MAKIGRNAPCPCGSGKKFKRCCGAGVQYVGPQTSTPEAEQKSDAQESARLAAMLKKAHRISRSALKNGDEKQATQAVAAALTGEFFDPKEAGREAKLILAETLGRMDGARDAKNAVSRAKRAGEKAFNASGGSKNDMIARRDRAQSAILASFEASGMGFDPQAPTVQRLLAKIVPPGG